MKALFWVMLLLLLPRQVLAHEVGLSRGEYRASAGELELTLVLAQRDAALLLPGLDPNADGSISEGDVSRERDELERRVLGRVSVTVGGERCPVELRRAAATERDGLLLEGRYRCPGKARVFETTLGFLEALPRGHRHAARIVSGPVSRDVLLFGESISFQVPQAVAETPQESSDRPSLLGFVKLGFDHILSGYDHLLFLGALVLARARGRALLGIVSAFTVGHSLSLACAVLGLGAPSSSLVEPGIALSVGYVAVENFRGLDPNKRWRITFPFGLLHGFGFAGALSDIELTRAQLGGALLSFNVGVELGQLCVLGVLVPLAMLLQRSRSVPSRTLPLLNSAILATSACWFLQRVFL